MNLEDDVNRFLLLLSPEDGDDDNDVGPIALLMLCKLLVILVDLLFHHHCDGSHSWTVFGSCLVLFQFVKTQIFTLFRYIQCQCCLGCSRFEYSIFFCLHEQFIDQRSHQVK